LRAGCHEVGVATRRFEEVLMLYVMLVYFILGIPVVAAAITPQEVLEKLWK
jgi:hypothetical protein